MSLDTQEATANNETLAMHETEIPLWDELDLDNAQLGGGTQRLEPADAQEAKQILGRIDFRLPLVLTYRSVDEVPAVQTPLQVDLEGPGGLAYHLLGVPLSIILPPGLRLARVGLSLTFKTRGAKDGVVAHALAPTSQIITESRDYGRVSLDVSKALQFVFPPAAECLGLQLAFPLRWESEYPVVQADGLNSNVVNWLVEDEAVREGFIAYVITRSERPSPFQVEAEVAAELHQAFLGRIRRARFASDRRKYTVADR